MESHVINASSLREVSSQSTVLVLDNSLAAGCEGITMKLSSLIIYSTNGVFFFYFQFKFTCTHVHTHKHMVKLPVFVSSNTCFITFLIAEAPNSLKIHLSYANVIQILFK